MEKLSIYGERYITAPATCTVNIKVMTSVFTEAKIKQRETLMAIAESVTQELIEKSVMELGESEHTHDDGTTHKPNFAPQQAREIFLTLFRPQEFWEENIDRLNRAYMSGQKLYQDYLASPVPVHTDVIFNSDLRNFMLRMFVVYTHELQEHDMDRMAGNLRMASMCGELEAATTDPKVHDRFLARARTEYLKSQLEISYATMRKAPTDKLKAEMMAIIKEINDLKDKANS
jgi:hypothetical protein